MNYRILRNKSPGAFEIRIETLFPLFCIKFHGTLLWVLWDMHASDPQNTSLIEQICFCSVCGKLSKMAFVGCLTARGVFVDKGSIQKKYSVQMSTFVFFRIKKQIARGYLRCNSTTSSLIITCIFRQWMTTYLQITIYENIPTDDRGQTD